MCHTFHRKQTYFWLIYPRSLHALYASYLDPLIRESANSKHDCLIAGDWNIDLLKYYIHFGTESFVNNLHANLLIPVITRSTRFSEISPTLIDNFLTNKPQNLLVAGALICDISDHLPIFFVSKKMQKKIKQKLLHYIIQSNDT